MQNYQVFREKLEEAVGPSKVKEIVAMLANMKGKASTKQKAHEDRQAELAASLEWKVCAHLLK